MSIGSTVINKYLEPVSHFVNTTTRVIVRYSQINLCQRLNVNVILVKLKLNSRFSLLFRLFIRNISLERTIKICGILNHYISEQNSIRTMLNSCPYWLIPSLFRNILALKFELFDKLIWEQGNITRLSIIHSG